MEQNEQSIDQTQEQDSINSVLGTFKDVESLKKSYDNLRSEFTRKSQELSRLNKLVGDKEQQTPPNVANTSESQKEEDKKSDFWDSPSWQQNTEKFFDEYSVTDNEKDALAQILVQDKEILNSVSPLHSAYIKLLKNSSAKKDEIANDEQFLQDFVYKNDKIKQTIITEYLNNIKKRDSVPEVMPNSAANFAEEAHSTPKTLKEAKQLASKYFD